MRISNIILSLCLAVLSPAVVSSEDDASGRVQALFNACDKTDVPGGFAAAVIKDGSVLFKKAYGYADSENEVLFTTHTVIDMASVAKQFTGYAVAVLVRDGKLGMDDDIRSYLPEVPDFGETITVRHLLYHTSGIRDWVGLVKISGRYKEDVISDDFLWKLVMNQTDLNFKPGESFQYSNTGYFLLAGIVSRVTGSSFPQWMRENVFEPLNMNDTHFSDNYGDIIPHRASSYKKNDAAAFQKYTSNLESCGSSSLFSTLDDMIKWAVNYETMIIGGRDVWKMMLTKGTLNDKKNVDYGFGVSIDERNGVVSYGHGGSWGGYLSQVTCYPEYRLIYILISNRDPSGVYVDDKLVSLFTTETSKNERAEQKALPRRTEVAIAPDLLDDYSGAYQFFSDNVVRIENKGDHLVAVLPWESVDIYPESENKFFRKDFDAQFEFIRENGGEVNWLIYYFKGGKNPPFKKLTCDTSRTAGAMDPCGDYYCPELRTEYKIVVTDNCLTLWHLQNEAVTLLRRNKDNYLGDQWWCEEIKLLRDQNDRITGLTLKADGGNVQKLRFVKK